MKIKSYFARTVEEAIARARQELGAEAMLIESRKAPLEARHLGEYEVVFAADVPTSSVLSAAALSAAAPPEEEVPERLAGEVAELKKQLEAMRRALNRSAFAPPQWLGASPELPEAYALLAAQDVAPALAREIVQEVAARSGGAWQTALAAAVASRFRVEPQIGVGEARPRILALVGPPGAGKTTTLVKLAVTYGLACRRSALLLSMDTYRVAAAEQLRAYASILGVGFQLLETVLSLSQALEENSGKDLILIDTPGYSFADLDLGADLARFLTSRRDIDTQLVLSSSMKTADLTHVIDGYEIFRPRRLLFTKLDETTAAGPILNEAVRTEKPLSFFTAGQRIPEDLEEATPGRLLDLLLGGSVSHALSAA